ncbi:DUF4123 domain-containing protein [Cupriavidus sp. SW-Y-13]|uniref:DUF4123 domain-containing protein n=1 Tax=Cupriavidus sp. SW-Y-13 TaxID=2653854 RepID=UPI00136551BD|nr:DUF4123 domain-containing protein [Cupriavidus sp. SW-Y-13]MWL90917.1 DUF4123 domain-containing protein [Cupriavidus sp. SW-Y-13]
MNTMNLASNVLGTFRSLRDLEDFGHVYLVVDPLAGSTPLAYWAERVPSDKQWILPYRPARDSALTSPRLFLLDASRDDVLEDSLICAGAVDDPQDIAIPNTAICGWLFSRVTPLDLSSHLVTAMQQRNARREPVCLRYYDPRVLPRLNVILDAGQRSKLLGPVEYWFAMDRAGTFANLQTQPPRHGVSASISATAEQWASIDRIGALNRTIDIIEKHKGVPLPADKQADVDVLLVRAARHGLTSLEDAITFALFAFLFSRDFDQHPEVIAAIADCNSQKTTLLEALKSLSNDVWQDIAQRFGRPVP